MKKLRLHLLFSFLLVFLPIYVQNSFACSCYPLPSVYGAYNQSKAVFTGKILSSEDVKVTPYNERHYRVQILENFKGVKEKEVTISAGVIESSCFWGGYTVGESYLIYSHGESNGILNAENACTRTTALNDAQSQVIFIRELLKGKTESKVYGSVAVNENNLRTDETTKRFLPEIEVRAKSADKTFKTFTDKNGFYRFGELPEGIYKLELQVPAKYKLYFPENESFAVMKNKRICRNQYSKTPDITDSECYFEPNLSDGIFFTFSLRWNNEIKGKILDAEGKIVEKASMRLLPLAKARDNFDEDWRDDYRRTGEDYFVIGKTPGQYILAVEIDSPLGSNNKIRFFYPQTNLAENAKIFDITETTKLNLDFKLPENIKTRKLIGEVLTESGGSVGGYIKVSLDSLEDFSNQRNKQFAEMSVNSQGQFEFNVLENEDYWLHFWINDFEAVNGEVKEIKKLIKTEKVKIGKEAFPRKITIALPQN